jgi:hypothetical protein
VASLDLPDQPDEAGRPERVVARGADQPDARPRETPDPDDRGRAYEATQAYVSAETRAGSAEEGPQPDEQPRATNDRTYWDDVPRFMDMRASLEQRWPSDQRVAPDRSADPPGSYRSDGGFYLDTERHVEATAAIGRMRQAEPKISDDVQAAGRENAHGGWVEGFDRRLKGEGRLKEKIAVQIAVEPDKPPSEILRKVPDAIRYTFCFQPATYTSGYYDIKERMESFGYRMYQSTGWWDDPEYKGVNTRWVTAEGQRFEVQFHTPESYHAKQYVTHDAYKRLRNPLTSHEERSELEAFQREVSSRIQIPDGAADIPDFKKEGF